jgi:hypothetical protein
MLLRTGLSLALGSSNDNLVYGDFAEWPSKIAYYRLQSYTHD